MSATLIRFRAERDVLREAADTAAMRYAAVVYELRGDTLTLRSPRGDELASITVGGEQDGTFELHGWWLADALYAKRSATGEMLGDPEPLGAAVEVEVVAAAINAHIAVTDRERSRVVQRALRRDEVRYS